MQIIRGTCFEPISDNVTLAECCCRNIPGAGWSTSCQRCPPKNTGKNWFPFNGNSCEHVEVVDVNEYCYVFAVNIDFFNTENKEKFTSGLFHMGENVLCPTITTEWEPRFKRNTCCMFSKNFQWSSMWDQYSCKDEVKN